MLRIFLFLIFFPTLISAQSPDWGGFQNLMDKTWEAEGKWGDGSVFKQSIHFSFDLNKAVVIAKAKGFTDEARTEFGNRNHGVRKYDSENKKFVFWEFDVFGGVTQGDLILENKNIIYQYQYGTSIVTDMWKYENDSTYTFIVGAYKDGTWTQKYLETTFRQKRSIQSTIAKIKKYLVGEWSSKAWDGILVETWKYKNGRLTQKADYSEKGKVVYEAKNFLEEKAGELILTTIIKNNNPKVFKATKIENDLVVFENTDYANPSKVTYQFHKKGFDRTIEGKENGKPTSYTFKFKKVNQDQGSLVPRRSIYTPSDSYRKVKVDDQGEFVYFQNSSNPTEIVQQSIEPLPKKEVLSYQNKVVDYVCMSQNLIVVTAGDQIELFQNQFKINLPDDVKSLRIHRKLNDGSLLLEASKKSSAELLVLKGRQLSFLRKRGFKEYRNLLFDGKGNVIAANASSSTLGNEILVRDQDSLKVIVSTDWGAEMFLGGLSKAISVSDDGQLVYFTSNKNTDKTKLYKYNRQNGKTTKLLEIEEADLLPFGFSSNGKGEVTSLVGLFAESIRVSTDKETGEDFDFLKKQLSADISFMQSVKNDSKWLVRALTGGSGNVYLFDRKTKTSTLLILDDSPFDLGKVAKRYAHHITTEEGFKIPFHVYLPAGSDTNQDGIPDQPLPTILYVHGGPWVGIGQWNSKYFWRNYQFLANRGYAVVVGEFRGTTGLGKKITKASYKQWGKSMMEDKIKIIDHAIAKKISDPNRIGIWGWSYGGYATQAALAFYPEKFQCGISMFGISDLVGFLKTDFAKNDWWRISVGDIDDPADAKNIEAISPFHHAEKITAPLLLTTGSKDVRVRQNQVDTMAQRMTELNKEVIYFYYPEEVHDYIYPESWISFWAISEHFLKEHLGGQAEPIGKDLVNGGFEIVEGEDIIKRYN